MSLFEVVPGVKMNAVVAYSQIMNCNKAKHFNNVSVPVEDAVSSLAGTQRRAL